MAVALAEFQETHLAGFSDADLLLRAKSGDLDAMDQFIAGFEVFVRRTVSSLYVPGMDREDVIQLGRIGLWQAIQGYDPSAGVTFVRFASICIRREVLQRVTQFSRKKWQFEFSVRPLEDRAVEETTLWDVVADKLAVDPARAYADRLDYDDTLCALASSLTEFERDVLRHWLSGIPYTEVAERVGRHKKAVDNAVQRIKRKLRRHLERRAAEEAVV